MAVQLLLFPESADEIAKIPTAADPGALPKIKLTDNLYDIRRAFDEVQQQVGVRMSKSPELLRRGSSARQQCSHA